jgi:UDP-N-acetyl-D-glucosamine dehydrogenase
MTNQVSRFADLPWSVGVIGLGYVGLPLLMTASESGIQGIGFDVSERVVADLAQSISHVGDVSSETLSKAIAAGTRFTTDTSELSEADAILICVPSPLGRNRQPDLSYIEAAADAVSAVARPGQLICLESTTYPGTTEDYLVPAVEKAGLRLDEDVWVAFSSERVSPGDLMKTGDIPKVVGGVTPMSGEVAAAAYRRIVPSVHLVGSARAAEMSKLLENTYRAVNIGLINEVAQLCHELGIDIWEVIDAAASKPFGFQAFYPGPGVGGHCIPLDPQFLAWRAREANFATRFIDTAEQVNSKMPAFNADRVADLLNRRGKAVFGTKVLGVGIAYKPNIADDRESAALDVLAILRSRGAVVSVLDPLVGPDRIEVHGYEPVAADDDLSGFEVAVILTDHDGVDYRGLADQVPAIYDTRGVYRRLGIEASNVERL